MKLFFKKTGEGKPLIILHGLFGLGDNWATLGRQFSENGFCCYLVDLRNHGRSDHSEVFNYEAMSDDIAELMKDQNIDHADFIGHSMGGKALMFFSLKYPELIDKMIIADISPRYYEQHHQSIFAALDSIDIKNLTSRKEAEEKLRTALNSESTIQFLLKNLYWIDDTHLGWRFGLKEIEKNIEEVGKVFAPGKQIDSEVLFLKGDKSGYINEKDEGEIKNIFPNSTIKTIPDAGHWVHAENPGKFLESSLSFLKGK